LRELLADAEFIGFRLKGRTPVLNPNFGVKQGASLEEEYGIALLPTPQDAYKQQPDLAVIAVPTALQARYVIDAADHGVDVLVEKPGALNLNEAGQVISAVRSNGIRFLISYQRRFHPLIHRLRRILARCEIGKLMSVRIVVGSHVPDWHPYEDFRGLYACRADLGGGVVRTECHEIDLVTWLFGAPTRVEAVTGRRGPHDIDVEDSAEILMDYETFAVQLSLCFMQRRSQRHFTITGQDGWIELDLVAQRMEMGRGGSRPEIFTDAVENDVMFRRQAQYFLHEFEAGDEHYLDALERNAAVIDRSLARRDVQLPRCDRADVV